MNVKTSKYILIYSFGLAAVILFNKGHEYPIFLIFVSSVSMLLSSLFILVEKKTKYQLLIFVSNIFLNTMCYMFGNEYLINFVDAESKLISRLFTKTISIELLLFILLFLSLYLYRKCRTSQ